MEQEVQQEAPAVEQASAQEAPAQEQPKIQIFDNPQDLAASFQQEAAAAPDTPDTSAPPCQKKCQGKCSTCPNKGK